MNLKSIIVPIWIVGSIATVGSFHAPVKDELKDNTKLVTTVTAGGLRTIYINGQGVTQQAVPVKPEKIEQPTQPQVAESKPDDITDGVWEWKSLVEQYFPQSEVINALRIMSAENGSGDPKRISKPNRNGTIDHGLFQINTCHKNRVDGDLSQLQDAETNVRIAHDIWSEQGWKPWSTAKKLGL